MTVRELAELYIEGSDNMEIWEIEKEQTVFNGTFCEAITCEYAEREVGSFGVEDGIIVMNI